MDFSTVTITNNKRMKLEGRDYNVLKVTMLVEGVHQGNNGPLYYPADELSRLPASWNGRSVTINHPQHNGTNISANHPEIVDKVRIGTIFNTFWDTSTKKLKAEAWIDSDRLRKLNSNLWAKVTSNQIVEVSTGLFSDNEGTSGTFNGKEYVGIARNFNPDHLALLTDSPGACSVNDGCGLNVNINNESESIMDSAELNRACRYLTGEELAANCNCGNKPTANIERPEPLGLPSWKTYDSPKGTRSLYQHSNPEDWGGHNDTPEVEVNGERPEPLGMPSWRNYDPSKGTRAYYNNSGNWQHNEPPDKISVPDHEVPPPLGTPKYKKPKQTRNNARMDYSGQSTQYQHPTNNNDTPPPLGLPKWPVPKS